MLFVAAVLVALIGARFVLGAGTQSTASRSAPGRRRLLFRFPRCRRPPSCSPKRRCADDGWGGREGRPTDRRGAAVSHCCGKVVDRGRDAARAHRPHGEPARGRPCSRRGRSGEEAAAAQLGRDLRPGSQPLGFDGAATGGSVLAHRHASSRRSRTGGGRDRPRRDLPQCSHLRSAQAGMASRPADALSACAAGCAGSFRRASSDCRRVWRQSRGVRPEEPASGRRWEVLDVLAHPVLASLRNGDVLLATGVNEAGQVFTSASLFDPKTDRWSSAAAMAIGRDSPIGAELRDGRVLVAGGAAEPAGAAIGRDLRLAEQPLGSRRRNASGTIRGVGPLAAERKCAGLWRLLVRHRPE